MAAIPADAAAPAAEARNDRISFWFCVMGGKFMIYFLLCVILLCGALVWHSRKQDTGKVSSRFPLITGLPRPDSPQPIEFYSIVLLSTAQGKGAHTFLKKETTMDEQERKEHFQGFAELLMQELNKNDLLDLSNARIQDTIEQRKTRLIKQIIAERAYDLVLH